MSYSHALEVGDKAPDFNLQSTDGNRYQLSDVLEKEAVVLAQEASYD